MAFDVWPVSLPQQILMDGNNYEIGDGRLFTQPDAGPAIIYPRCNAVVDRLQGHMFMTLTQYNALLVFGRTTLLKWSSAFTFKDPFNPPAGTILTQFSQNLPRIINVSGSKYDVSIDLWVCP